MKLGKSVIKPVGATFVAGAVVAITISMNPAAAVPVTTAVPAAKLVKDVERAPDGKYIVGLTAQPVALYAGGVDGIPATMSKAGAKLDRTSASVDRYRSYLDDARADVLAAVPGVTPFYEYDWAYAGFAAELSYEQAQQLARQPGVSGVWPNELIPLETTHSPEFLGLTAEGGLWEQTGGPEDAGEGLVIGVLDTGITPESGSFAPLEEPAPIPDGWTGTCEAGDPDDLGGGTIGDEETQGTQPAAIECDGDVINNKVIGARYYLEGFGAPDPDEFVSPRDIAGHGSHTSSTSAGNYDVPITVAGAALGRISGMAPRARIAMYKVCWDTPAGGSCATADSTAAIDQALSDGVDAINYSIGGSLDTANDPVATGFRSLAAAGVFVSASAGNSGPAIKTVAHNYPWVTTVAASTQDREYRADVIVNGGEVEVSGASISTGVGPAPAVFAKNVPADGVDPGQAQLCMPDSLDAEQVEGKIVVCMRGTNARIEKSAVVAAAGGIGMVLANDGMSGVSVVTERHSVPTVHLAYLPGQDVIEAVGRDEIDPDATIELGKFAEFVGADEVEAPGMATFSSRGPALMADGDILKPDITAIGVDVLATLAPYEPNADEMYGFMSGTSMSSPHIAGLSLLLKDLHPDWSPMAIKSAMMTGAYQTNNQGDPIKIGIAKAGAFEYGAGHVEPQDAAATPLVYDSTPDDWVQWMCGTFQLPDSDPQCQALGPIDPSDLNLASIAINDVAGFKSTTRTVTNVTDEEVTATVSIEKPDGFKITVEPSEITVPAGGTATYTVTVQHTNAPLDKWATGGITWDTGEAVVRSPLAVRADSFAAPVDLVGTQATGSITAPVTAGTDGTFTVAYSGLDDAQVDRQILSEPTSGSFPPDPPNEPQDPLPPHIMRAIVDVPEGTDLARFELFVDDYAVGTDLDLFVYLDGTQIASSATGIPNEKVSIDNPVAGEYHVYVDLWALASGETEAEIILHSWTVHADSAVGDFTVTPDEFEAETGESVDLTFSWSGLEGPDTGMAITTPSDEVRRYLGITRYLLDGAVVDQTLLRVDVPPGAPPTTDPTTEPPTTEPTTEPPTTEPTSDSPTPTTSTTLPGTGGGDAGLYAGLGVAALLAGGLLIALAARRLRDQG